LHDSHPGSIPFSLQQLPDLHDSLLQPDGTHADGHKAVSDSNAALLVTGNEGKVQFFVDNDGDTLVEFPHDFHAE
jgi:hypothetical protein